uniref:NADH dehydrogenase [ubiquinone] iron-sulfur protein 4, mitochondrial n=1 Tax=Polytomella parva TaxID=51329 RepID=A0A7S0VGQ2_9CHLO|mmetsp:Transcript_32821/g.59484  ORF Transcript_32821/g.59484 Transcript_32821/m.59484 type:complete len:186 (+) Transcript_32821:49-606(+)|eukprot:CAMPEP_0175054078 /NCGR_PEP_ID=MMETSP0052_2-20121109/9297_1 /TAXON_ID=51329 ORGANISM="Polytomella parva, Strain SAG 63-3" /NCGR_SAMPLE_ID=MMETSP0052_2 /ASSEMBLY_ACC=CAM_ASM_000194 /LENGTH=185 /DNA_ID=CAMNT_0016318717 /DNA_START=32 /DNA_END=589 /DNA_ORIENTATION=+
MLRKAVSTLFNLEKRVLYQQAGFATAPQDFSLAMKKADEIYSGKTVKAGDIGFSAGVPLETYNRKVRIFCPAKAASQSGLGRTLHPSSKAPQWKIVFENLSKWENPLMGWTSTADPLENVGRSTLLFYTKEEAAAFCAKHGWEYVVDEPNPRNHIRQKRYLGYGDNYSIKRKGVPDLAHLPSNRS